MTGPTLTEHMPAGKPDAEVDVNEALVRRLLESQHPDLAALPLTHLDSGWDNVLFRLGGQHLVRAPRREIAAGLIQHEQVRILKKKPGEGDLGLLTAAQRGDGSVTDVGQSQVAG